MAIEWKSVRTGVTAYIAPFGHLSVSYEASVRVPFGEPHYNVRVFGEHLKGGRSVSIDEGKSRAEAHAKHLLRQALEALG